MGRTIAIILCAAIISGSAVYGIMRYQTHRDADRRRASSDDNPEIATEGPFVLEDGEFQPLQVVEERPVVGGFKVISRKEAGSWLGDEELVVGVVIDGKPRAYPINILTGPAREILNDTLAGKPIAATW